MEKDVRNRLGVAGFLAIMVATWWGTTKSHGRAFYGENNKDYGNAPYKRYYNETTSMFLTEHRFSSVDGESEIVKPREIYSRYNFFTGGVYYEDTNSPITGERDGEVDEITYTGRFNGKRTTLTRVEHYNTHKSEFDRASKKLAKVRGSHMLKKRKLARIYSGNKR